MKIKLKYIFLLLLSISIATPFYSQNKKTESEQSRTIDSLEKILKTNIHDTNRVIILNSLSQQLLDASNYKKALFYAEEAFLKS